MSECRPRFWLCRIYVCMSVLTMSGIGLLDSNSQHHDSLNTDGMGGAAALTYLTAASLVGILDTIGHDLLGWRSWLALTIRRFRFLWCMALTVGMMALIFANVRWGDVQPLIARYALDASFALFVGVADIWTRRR